MAQFDQFCFFNQVSWFLVSFFSFYFIILYFFLPKISNIIKFRRKKIKTDFRKKINFDFEYKSKFFFFNNLYKNFYLNIENIYKKKLCMYFKNQNDSVLISFHFINKLSTFINKKFLMLEKI